MESKAKLLGHPVHPFLIVFPLGLLSTSVIFDIIGLSTGDGQWTVVALYMIGAGLVGGVIAAVFGLIDWLAIPLGTRAKDIGLAHAVGNTLALLMFLGSFLLRQDNPAAPSGFAYALSFAGFLVSMASGWLGGELVDRLGVGVDDGAHLNSPSSLSGRAARETQPGLTKPTGR